MAARCQGTETPASGGNAHRAWEKGDEVVSNGQILWRSHTEQQRGTCTRCVGVLNVHVATCEDEVSNDVRRSQGDAGGCWLEQALREGWISRHMDLVESPPALAAKPIPGLSRGDGCNDGELRGCQGGGCHFA